MRGARGKQARTPAPDIEVRAKVQVILFALGEGSAVTLKQLEFG